MSNFSKLVFSLKAIAQKGFILLAFMSCFFWQAIAHAEFKISCPEDKQVKIKAQSNPDYRQTITDGVKEQFSSAAVECNSCFRSVEEQAQACQRVCGTTKGCPGSCAPPGKSNHQHVATCDIQKLPGDVKKGCEFLFDMCQKMRQQDKSLGCEIGGYGSGAHHLAVGPGIRNSAYNQCSFLKPKMGMDPGSPDKLKKEGDDLYNQVMNPQPQPGTQDPSSISVPEFAKAGPPAQYPTASSSRGPSNFTALPPGTVARGGNKVNVSPDDKIHPKDFGIGPSHEHRYSDITKEEDRPVIPGGKWNPQFGRVEGGNGASEITKGQEAYAGGPAGAPGSGATAAAGNTPPGWNPGGGAQGFKGKNQTAASEVLSGFAGAKTLGASNLAQGGSDSEAGVKDFVKDFADAAHGGADARQGTNGIGSQDGGTLFDRCHAAHLRCLRGGCVSGK